MSGHWYTKSAAAVFSLLQTSERGLSTDEAARRLKESGLNELPAAQVDHLALIFLRQFQSPLIYILLAASAAVFLMGEPVDGSIILAVLLFNAVVGTFQEGKAQNTLLALKKFVKTSATVCRNGREVILDDAVLVPGDLIILQEGERVPADARVIDSHNLKTDEAALTGESMPVHKTAEALTEAETGLATAEQRNMLFKGTHIVAGNGRAVVTATGLNTVIGKISKEIGVVDTEIPLKAEIRRLSRLIILTVAVISVILFVAGLVYGKTVREMFATVVSLSVSIIPEGLPIVITLVLATGVLRMSKRRALVKRLQAVEALGQAKIIAVDKTGTITRNELVIQKVYAGGQFFEIGGVGYDPAGGIKLDGQAINPSDHPVLFLIGRIAAFCASARVSFDTAEQRWRVAGDPTEAAILVLSRKIGCSKEKLEQEAPVIGEIPFDYKNKYHATLHQDQGGVLLTVVGAPETVLARCSKVYAAGTDQGHGNRILGDAERQALEKILISWSEQGMRVLAVAFSRQSPEPFLPEQIRQLTFVGFFGMKDKLRPEVGEAMRRALAAGIKVVMITGDHKVTARAIAQEAGIFKPGDEILTGEEIDALTDFELVHRLRRTVVFARVTPEHKIRIIQAFKQRGDIVAMTGDGVNDAPSLVAADLGVAMGKIGTEVAKEASDIVLLDDNFGSIISAVEEGRSIYQTIKKVILYLFSTSVGEVLTIAGALFLGYPLPLVPAQIIWLNFVTDGFLVAALAMEPKEKNLLLGKAERFSRSLVDRLMWARILIMAVPMMLGTIFLFRGYFEADLTKAWTIALTVLAVFQWLNVWNCRSADRSIFQMNPFTNKFLVGAMLIVIFLQLLAVYHPWGQTLLRTAPLSFSEWLVIIGVAFSIILVEELRKWFHRLKLK